jgi:predicted O-linked N-acetylglucosamine transferase (SPINDLY family)
MKDKDIEQQMKRAVGLHQSGRLAEAGRLYEAILGSGHRDFEIVHLLGLLNYQQGAHEAAYRLLAQALDLNPISAPAWSNRGLVLQALRRHDEALASYDRALALDARHAEVYNNRGNALAVLKRHDQALASYERAIEINPSSAVAHNNRGNVLKALGRLEEALASYDRAIEIRPDYIDACGNRALALVALNRAGEALASYDRIIALKPNLATAHNGRGNLLRHLNRFDEAFGSFNRALALDPDLAEAHNSRGYLLKEARRFTEALASFDQAIALKPDYVEAHHNRAYVLFSLKRPDEAVDAYERIAALDPQDIYAFGGIANAALHCCDWERTRNIAAALDRDVAEGRLVIEPFTVLGYSDAPVTLSQCASNFSRYRVPVPLPPMRRNAGYRHEKIRLAYVSADFRRHPVAYQIAELFERHDRSRFHLVGVSLGADDASAMRKRLVAAFDEFIDVRDTSDFDVASLLRQREVDIAVDLVGHTTSGRIGIFAHRPAPVQVAYLGYPGTMGVNWFDYIVADPVILPLNMQPYYVEKIVHLPECYLVNDRTRAIAPDVPTREAVGLPENGFVFCCFNTNYKITAEMFDVWMRLLANIENSAMWLARDNDVACRNLRAAAVARGIAPSRIVFADRVDSPDEHLARHRLADLFLDTLPYNAHSTGSSALWAGLPLITCMGRSPQSRVGASLLHAVGLPELIAGSLDDYERLATRLVLDRGELAAIRRRLEDNRLTCPLFDTDRFRLHIEAAYIRMRQIHQDGRPPESFAVATLP